DGGLAVGQREPDLPVPGLAPVHDLRGIRLDEQPAADLGPGIKGASERRLSRGPDGAQRIGARAGGELDREDGEERDGGEDEEQRGAPFPAPHGFFSSARILETTTSASS